MKPYSLFLVRLGFFNDEQANLSKVYVPICNYNDEMGSRVNPYAERYCDTAAFQPTFNDNGMCFTFNNRKQGMDEFFQRNFPFKDVENHYTTQNGHNGDNDNKPVKNSYSHESRKATSYLSSLPTNDNSVSDTESYSYMVERM